MPRCLSIWCRPSYANSATSATDQHYPEANPSDTHVPNANNAAVASYSQSGETNVAMGKVLENYTPYPQLNDSSCVPTRQAVSETASLIHHVAPYCTISSCQGRVCTTDGPARRYIEWPDSLIQGSQRISTSNNSGFDPCQHDTSQMDWLAAIDF